MRGEPEPRQFENRNTINRSKWSENWIIYDQNLLIQKDFEYICEAVFNFYQHHLDKFIRKNDKLWMDFCKTFIQKDAQGNDKVYLDLDTRAYDLTDPTVQVPATEKTVQPIPEDHFSFSTKMMAMSLQLYQEQVEHRFCPYAQFAYDKLVHFVDSRKELTQQSYRYFCEHAYNQFFVHEAFHQSARSRTRAKDIGNDTPLPESTKLSAYVWVQDDKAYKHVPKQRLLDDEVEGPFTPEEYDVEMQEASEKDSQEGDERWNKFWRY